LIFASWCGRPLKMEQIVSRSGWDKVEAVRHHRVYEIPGADILQPGYRIVYGYEQMRKVIAKTIGKERTASRAQLTARSLNVR